MKYATFEQDTFPNIIIRFSADTPNEEQFEEYLTEMKEIYDTKSGFRLIFDATISGFLPSKQRIRQGKWLAENNDLIKEKCLKHYYIVNSAIVKIVLNGILLVNKPPIPYAVFKTVDEALADAKK